jgi:hypothetical protein
LGSSFGNYYNPYFVYDVWDTCYSQKYACKKTFSSLYMSAEDPTILKNGNHASHEGTIENILRDPATKNIKFDVLENFVEKVLFVKSNENLNSIMVKHSTLYKSYVDLLSEFESHISPGGNAPSSSESNSNIPKPLSIWRESIQRVSNQYFSSSSQNSPADDPNALFMNQQVLQAALNNTDVMCFHKSAIHDMLYLIYKFHINLLVDEMTVLSFSIPRKLMVAPSSLPPFRNNVGKRSIENTERVAEKQEEQEEASHSASSPRNDQQVTLNKCSENSYARLNPQTGAYECVCFADKNCLINIQDVTSMETSHPLIILSAVLIIILTMIIICMGTSNDVFL